LFYVYTYSSNGVPYYVGKGQKARDVVHLNMAKNPKVAKETACIAETRRLLEGNSPVEVKRVADGLSEVEAFELEKALITQHGRRQHGGLLVNRTAGGQGACGAVRSPEERARVGAMFRGIKLSPERCKKTSDWNKAHGKRPPLKYGAEHPRAKAVTVRLPDGTHHSVPCLKEFCSVNGLNMSTVRNTLYEKRPIKRGPWAGLMLMC
jgi:hypothetical protein